MITKSTQQDQLFIAVLGSFGGRMDQSLQVISSTVRMCRASPQLDIFLLDECSMMYRLRPSTPYLLKKSQFQQKKGCGLISFGKAANVRTKGLKWEFNEKSGLSEIEFGALISTSNEMVSDELEVSSDHDLFWVTTMKWYDQPRL